MKSLFILLPIAFVLFSCHKKNDDKTIIDTSIAISLKDNNGNDLLNPNNPNSYNTNTIKILYEIDGTQIEFYDSKLDYPKGYYIYKHENEYRIVIFPNDNDSQANPITYIKWNDIDTDTIKCKVDRKHNSEICTKVWYNGNLVWNNYDTERFFTITKN